MWYNFNNSLERCREHQVRWYKISVLILPRWPKISPIDFSSSVLSDRQIIVRPFFYWRKEFSCSKITEWLIVWYGFVFVKYQLGLAPVNFCLWEKQIIAGGDGNWLVWWLVPQSAETQLQRGAVEMMQICTWKWQFALFQHRFCYPKENISIMMCLLRCVLKTVCKLNSNIV